MRVNVQLINARNDSHLWAEKYDRKLTDVFGVESEIAKAIADTLEAKLTGLEQRAIATRPTQNADAHQLYLKGTFFSNKRTGADLRTAIEYFKGAIDKDPNYALAYAGLADAYHASRPVRRRSSEGDRAAGEGRRHVKRSSSMKLCLKRTTHSVCCSPFTTLISPNRKVSSNGQSN